jgi:hypothetical protein
MRSRLLPAVILTASVFAGWLTATDGLSLSFAQE